jgi:hypothetical protein
LERGRVEAMQFKKRVAFAEDLGRLVSQAST